MLVHRARDRTTRLLDFFVAAPGLGRPRKPAEMESVDVDFDSETTQVFHIGTASCAVPGNAAGLEEAHRAFGSLPWPRLVAPALELAHDGFELTRQQAYLHAILDVILRHTPEGRRVYAEARGRRPAPPSRPRRHARADRRPGREGAVPRRARAGDRRAPAGDGRGGHGRRPGRLPRHPAPAAVGELPPPRGALEPAAVLGRRPDRLRARAARPAPERAGRKRQGDRAARRGDGRADPRPRARLRARALPRRAGLEPAREREREACARRGCGRCRGTTHISAIDERGNAASLSASAGSGSG